MASASAASAAAAAQLRAIFPACSSARALELVEACTGNVDAAVSLFLQQDAEAPLNPAAAAAAAAAVSAPSQRVFESIDDDDEAAAASDSAAMTDVERKQSDAPLRKRKLAAPAAAAATPSPSKKARQQKAADTDSKQHSLATFFAKSPTAAPAASAASAAALMPSSAAANGATLGRKLNAASRAAAAASSSAAAASSSSATAAAASTFAAPAAAAAAASSSPFLSLSSSANGDASTDPLKPCFRPGEPVPFVFLSRIFHLIENENGRLKIINYLSYLFWQILAYTPADLAAALFLSSDQLAPSYENHQMGVGGALLVRLVEEMTGVSHARLAADHARLGDLGLIAAQYRLTQSLLFRPAPLTTAGVFKQFHSLSSLNKRDRKEAVLKKLFAAAREDELTYLIRIAEGGLRIGSVITTVLGALAKAFVLHHLYTEGVPPERHAEACTFERVAKATDIVRGTKLALSSSFALEPVSSFSAASVVKRLPGHLAQATARIKRAYAELPSFHQILPVLLKSPTTIYSLHEHIRLTAGVPVKPQLGRPMTSIMSVLKLFKNLPFTVEVKYDGLRAQIHRLGPGKYRIFSRHLMDQRDRWKDLIPGIEAAIRVPADVETFILDAEIVAIEHELPTEDAAAAASSSAAKDSFRILPFQQLSTRRRGTNGAASAAPAAASDARVEVRCMVYVFDYLSLNGQSLLLDSLPCRRKRMAETFAEQAGVFQFVEHVDISAESTRDLEVEDIDDEEEQKGKKKAGGKAAAIEPDSSEDEEDPEAAAALPAAKKAFAEDDADAIEELDTDGFLEQKGEAVEEEAESAVAAASSSAAAAASSAASSLAPPSASDQISSFLNSVAIVRGEGVMCKSLSSRSTYEPDARTDQWCKLKKDYIAGFGIADSIDVCIIGAWFGNGRKAGWLSPFLAAVWNPDTEEYESFAKIMSGFTDEMYKQLTAECEKLIIPGPKKYYRVSEGLRPTMWFSPVKVWEIRGADLTISPKHSAGIGILHPNKGISLRFPRFIRVRDDKGPEQCTTSDQIAALYQGQSGAAQMRQGFRRRD